MAVDAGIFKAYDVRGLYGEQIDADVAYRVGRAFAQVIAGFEGAPASSLQPVGHDMRLTPPSWPSAISGHPSGAQACSTSGWWARRCSISRSVRSDLAAGDVHGVA